MYNMFAFLIMCYVFFFFFQAEDGIRDLTVTGVQTCDLPISAPMMNSSTTATFTNTMMLLTLADSLMPMTSSVVMMAMMMMAGRLNTAVTCGRVFGSIPRADTVCSSASVTAFQPCSGMWISCVPRAAERAAGTSKPTSCRNDTTYPDQPMATVTAPSAYSSTRSRSPSAGPGDRESTRLNSRPTQISYARF